MRVTILNNLLVMDAWVNGCGPLVAVLDTGASVSVVSPTVADRANLVSAATTKSQGMGQGLNQTVDLVWHTRLEWGPDKRRLKLDDRTVALVPLDYIYMQTGVQAEVILGAEAHAKQVIKVDYAKQFVVFNPSRTSLSRACRVPIEFVSGMPFVRAELTWPCGFKVNGYFKIDSGMSGALVLSRNFLTDHPALAKDLPFVRYPTISAVGGAIDLELIRLHALALGDFQLAKPVAAVPTTVAGTLAQPGVTGIIGADVLRRFTVIWDYRDAAMWLTPNTAFQDSFEADASGLSLRNAPRGITAVAVMTGSPAMRAGIEAGDVVLGVDGKESTRLSDLKRRLTQAGQTVTMFLGRNGKRKTVHVKLERMV